MIGIFTPCDTPKKGYRYIPSTCRRSLLLFRPRRAVLAKLERQLLIFLALPSAHPSGVYVLFVPRENSNTTLDKVQAFPSIYLQTRPSL